MKLSTNILLCSAYISIQPKGWVAVISSSMSKVVRKEKEKINGNHNRYVTHPVTKYTGDKLCAVPFLVIHR